MRVILVLVCLVWCGRATAEDACTLLLRQTQAFSDAGQAGDAVVMDRLLDPRVVFVNESGEIASKQDLLESAQKPPRAIDTHMKIMDWSCVLLGDVAVARFTDDKSGTAYGQAVHAQFRSVESWQKQAAAWRMIGSATVALQDDPAFVALPAAVLEEYVGTYHASPELSVAVSRKGDVLMAALNGGAPVVQRAELRDVFFTPGQPRVRKIFRRDGRGAVVDFVSRHEGHDVVFTRDHVRVQ